MVATELHVTCRGGRRDVYVRPLAGYVGELGGRLEEGGGQDLVARVGGRSITLRFD
jgi:hypothetical protein